MFARRQLSVATAVLAFAASACSGSSDTSTEAGASTDSSAATSTSSTAAPTTVEADAKTTTSADSSAATSTTVVASIAPTSTVAAVDGYAVALAPDGLMIVEDATGSTDFLLFGTPEATLITAMTNVLGPPSEVSPGSSECSNGQESVAIWDNVVMLEFSDTGFLAWSLRPSSTLTDMLGIGWGTSIASLRSTWSITVEESTLGTEFTAAADGFGYGGLLSDDTDGAIVTDLWAGPICTFR